MHVFKISIREVVFKGRGEQKNRIGRADVFEGTACWLGLAQAALLAGSLKGAG